MKLIKFVARDGQNGVGLLEGDQVRPLDMEGGQFKTLSDLLEDGDVSSTVQFLVDYTSPTIALDQVALQAPIDRQEVWAAGVTYRRSQKARMDESAGAAQFYDLVYTAERPELFFKATPNRVAGPGEAVRIRQDSKWNVPEPELALVLSSSLQFVGVTIGNDMSSRDIEGENPLYLPQAKVYNKCCALGPCVTLFEAMPPLEETLIHLYIRRDNLVVFEGHTSLSNMARPFDQLISYLGRDNSFPDGVFLLTGTGIVPPDSFTLVKGDLVEISIDGIGTLTNPVVQG